MTLCQSCRARVNEEGGRDSLRHGLAVHSSSPCTSPCLLETKPDGSTRFITDFKKKLNAVTVPNSYPLQRMEDCIDNFGAAKFVSKLDTGKRVLASLFN